MKFIPAIDLKDNKCVRLKKGKEEEATIFHDDPVDQAKFFENNGCERIHLVDLDAAFGRVDTNKEIIIKNKEKIDIPIELGGGIKNKDEISFWLNKGIDFLIFGSLAIRNKNLILNLADKHNNKFYISVDVFKEKVMIGGWVEDSQLTVRDVVDIYNNSSINGFILTDISRDGMLKGLNINLIETFVSQTKKNVIVGGGLSNYNDLYNLKKIKALNLEGVIAGKSYYAGNIKIDKALKITDLDA